MYSLYILFNNRIGIVLATINKTAGTQLGNSSIVVEVLVKVFGQIYPGPSLKNLTLVPQNIW